MTSIDKRSTEDLLDMAEGMAGDLEFITAKLQERHPDCAIAALTATRARAAYLAVMQWVADAEEARNSGADEGLRDVGLGRHHG